MEQEPVVKQPTKHKRRKPILHDGRYQQAIENSLPHRWKPGESGNPSGKKEGTLNHETRLETISDDIQASINRIEKKRNESLLDHFVERAFNNDGVLVAVMKKIMPDLIKKEGGEAKETSIFYISVPSIYDPNNLPPKMAELVKRGILKLPAPAPSPQAVETNGHAQ